MADFEIIAAADMLRRNDSEEMRRQYARIPKPVLLSIMNIAGLANRRPDNLPGHVAAYHDGMAALCLEILTRAGFDIPSILAAGLSGSLEGEQRNDNPSAGGTGNPILADPEYEPNAEY